MKVLFVSSFFFFFFFFPLKSLDIALDFRDLRFLLFFFLFFLFLEESGAAQSSSGSQQTSTFYCLGISCKKFKLQAVVPKTERFNSDKMSLEYELFIASSYPWNTAAPLLVTVWARKFESLFRLPQALYKVRANKAPVRIAYPLTTQEINGVDTWFTFLNPSVLFAQITSSWRKT